MANPSVTAIMPILKTEKNIEEAALSVLNQTFTDFELLILNDASDKSEETEKMEEIINKLAEKDERIVYVKNDKSVKISKTLNRGIDMAKGKYIALTDINSVSLPERFEKQFKYMEDNADCGVLGSCYISLNEETGEEATAAKPENHREINVMGLFDRQFESATVMMRKSVLTENDLKYDSEYDGAEDFEFWSRAKHYTKFHNLRECLVTVKKNNSEISLQAKNRRAMLSNKIYEAAFREFLEEDFYIPLFTKLSFTVPELKESFNVLGEMPLMRLKEDSPFTRKEISYACGMHMQKLFDKIDLPKNYLEKYEVEQK